MKSVVVTIFGVSVAWRRQRAQALPLSFQHASAIKQGTAGVNVPATTICSRGTVSHYIGYLHVPHTMCLSCIY